MNKDDLKKLTGIYLILDRKLAKEKSYIEIIDSVSKSGVKIVQLREKNISTREYLEIAFKVKEACEKNGIIFIVNDRVDIAYASNADGVHLGQDDLPPKYAREILGKNKIIGMSAGNKKELEYALNQDIDYISPGPVFSTSTKPDAGNAVGIDFVNYVLSNTEKPVIPIGGINSDNVKYLSNIGINKVAVISAILSSEDLQKATEKLFLALCKKNWA
ncbi:thiamine-phosphate pyrophosphorylase [Thermotomaculum hydrothermale]|uniref:Thiamine-phosphate synthase n=1 Tax=Thermotomaculum hydrothermale TaxID=981385 RepID=A0A7R6SYG6_9BACT|nr:thiamine phosphate synthase [Thermotomaculum hydrothermale]BBB32759.1 thiamine-phosphate pyrophosphorylase [Thermotomaculum hydrothermale]